MKKEFLSELKNLINIYSVDKELNTPDFILATYLGNTLDNFKITMGTREEWFKIKRKLYNFSCPCSWLHKGVTEGYKCKCGEVFDTGIHNYTEYQEGR